VTVTSNPSDRDDRISALLAQMSETFAAGEAARDQRLEEADQRLEEALEELFIRRRRVEEEQARRLDELRIWLLELETDLRQHIADTAPRRARPGLGAALCWGLVAGGGLALLAQALTALGAGTWPDPIGAAGSLVALAVGAGGGLALRRRAERSAASRMSETTNATKARRAP
jgi:hypothetical protein